jgi:transglutaminase-like putative cysteine protease
LTTFHVDCELDYEVQRQSVFVFNLAAAATPHQRVIAEYLSTSPQVRVDQFYDEIGHNRFYRANVAPGDFSVRYRATVALDPRATDRNAIELPLAELPGDVLSYLQSSRYCEVESTYAFALRRFGGVLAGYGRVQHVCEWIRTNVDYLVGSSTVTSGARDVLANRAGVCRDFAHLGITLCRALNIPARFVTAYTRYAEPPPDFHAVFEAYLGDRWHLFDATGLAVTDDLVRIGTGRDASDVSFSTFFGTATLRRLSPLVAVASGDETLAELQTPTSGIVIQPPGSGVPPHPFAPPFNDPRAS